VTETEEWAALLDELELGAYEPTSASGNVFLLTLPAAPDLALAVACYSGGTGNARPGAPRSRNVQVRIRGPKGDVRIGEAKALAVYAALHGLGQRALPGGTWVSLLWSPQDGPTWIGRDEQDRPEWTVNLRAEIDQS
jgi:hypothetical protein